MGEQTVVAPEGTRPLSVGLDPMGHLCAWMFVRDTDAPGEEISFYIFATGEPFPDRQLEFLGSVTQYPFVWHVFYFNRPF
jgi:hypothetical protein